MAIQKPNFHWKLRIVLLFEKYFGQEKQLLSSKAIEKARRNAERSVRLSNILFNKKVRVGQISDHQHKHIRYRIYQPSKASGRCILFFHSGGYTMFNYTSLDYSCRRICALTNANLISVDYRRTPENKFPAAHDDALEMLSFVHDNAEQLGVDPTKIIAMGDSAGGHLSGYLGIQAGTSGPRLAAQVLIYPWINMNMEFPSINENAEGLVLTKKELHWYVDQMFSDENDRNDVRANLLANRNLEGVSPTMVTVCQFDPLRDEGKAFAKLLSDAGVAVTLIEYPNMVHGYLYFPATFGKAADPFGDIAAFIEKHVPD